MKGRARRDRRGDGDVAAIIVVVPLALAVVLLFVLFLIYPLVTNLSIGGAR